MAKKRILVVDDATVVRRLLGDLIAADPDFELCGSASNGKMALRKIDELEPDLVTLDVEMPELDGLETLRRIRAERPHLPVIMVSRLTARGAEQTIDALSAGASDYVTKPESLGSREAALEALAAELLPKMKSLLAGARSRGARASAPAPAPTATAAAAPATASPSLPVPSRAAAAATAVGRALSGPPDVVVIGTSTGGPNALEVVLASVDPTIPVPILVVQHMPPVFTRILAERLDAKSPLRVVEAADGDEAEAGTVYIAPGDRHLLVQSATGARPRLVLGDGPPENSCRPAADVLFRSAAETFGSSVLAVVMTGMGQDGLRGVEAIVERGGNAIAQDEETSVVWGMPGFVARAGLASQVLPLEQLAAGINRRVRRSAVRSAVSS